MPEILQKQNGNTDWSKFFMAMAAGAIVVMQGYSQMQHNMNSEKIKDVVKNSIPAGEVKLISRGLTQKVESLETRLDLLEKAMIEQGVRFDVRDKGEK